METILALITIAYFIVLMLAVSGISARLDKQLIVHRRIEEILKFQAGVKFCASCQTIHGNDEKICRKCGKDKFM